MLRPIICIGVAILCFFCHCNEGSQNEEAGGGKQDDKGKVNEYFESATQVRHVGRRLDRGHVGFSFADQAC